MDLPTIMELPTPTTNAQQWIPYTYCELVIDAVHKLKNKNGSSRRQITKFIKSNTRGSSRPHERFLIKFTLKNLLKRGNIIGVSGRFRIATMPQDILNFIDELVENNGPSRQELLTHAMKVMKKLKTDKFLGYRQISADIEGTGGFDKILKDPILALVENIRGQVVDIRCQVTNDAPSLGRVLFRGNISQIKTKDICEFYILPWQEKDPYAAELPINNKHFQKYKDYLIASRLLRVVVLKNIVPEEDITEFRVFDHLRMFRDKLNPYEILNNPEEAIALVDDERPRDVVEVVDDVGSEVENLEAENEIIEARPDMVGIGAENIDGENWIGAENIEAQNEIIEAEPDMGNNQIEFEHLDIDEHIDGPERPLAGEVENNIIEVEPEVDNDEFEMENLEVDEQEDDREHEILNNPEEIFAFPADYPRPGNPPNADRFGIRVNAMVGPREVRFGTRVNAENQGRLRRNRLGRVGEFAQREDYDFTPGSEAREIARIFWPRGERFAISGTIQITPKCDLEQIYEYIPKKRVDAWLGQKLLGKPMVEITLPPHFAGMISGGGGSNMKKLRKAFDCLWGLLTDYDNRLVFFYPKKSGIRDFILLTSQIVHHFWDKVHARARLGEECAIFIQRKLANRN